MPSDTLIVVAAYDDTFTDNLDTFKGGEIAVMDTSGGGHPSGAYVCAYRENPDYGAYLFLQDSLRAEVPDCVEPFRKAQAPVVAWAFFTLFFDDDEQYRWVRSKYQGELPPVGIFGPIFYATRGAMRTLDRRNLFPRTPKDKLMAQGTERAWACAFHEAGLTMKALGPCVTDGISPRLFPQDRTFTKTFAGRT